MGGGRKPLPNEGRLAIIIVTWNNRDLIEACLRSALDEMAHAGLSGQIIVVDNASSDGTPEFIEAAFSSVSLIRSGANLGFAAGNNLGLRSLGFPDGDDLPEAVLLLNPDTIVRPGAFTAALSALREKDGGLIGASLFYEDGSFQHGAFRFPGLLQMVFDLYPMPARLYESALNGRYSRELYEKGEPFPIDFPLGAFFLLRRDVIGATGLFDESFWLYCEEIDWALRIRKAGFKAFCAPAAEIIHLAGKSTDQVRPKAFFNLWKARLQLYRKHYPPLKRALAIRLVRWGMRRQHRLFLTDPALTSEQRDQLLAACDTIIELTQEA